MAKLRHHDIPIRAGLWHKLGDMRPNSKSARFVRKKQQLDATKLSAIAMFYVARYATTRHKLRQYLERKVQNADWCDEMSPNIEAIVDRMVALGFVDDRTFASQRAAGLSRRGFGEMRVKQALRAAGIEPEDAEVAIAECDEPFESAIKFAKRKRFGPFSDRPILPEDKRRQLAAFARAGHTFAIASKILALNEECVQNGLGSPVL